MDFSIGFESAIIIKEQSTSDRCDLALKDLRALTATFQFLTLNMNGSTKLKVLELSNEVHHFDCSKSLPFPYVDWMDYFRGKTKEPPSENNSIKMCQLTWYSYLYSVCITYIYYAYCTSVRFYEIIVFKIGLH